MKHMLLCKQVHNYSSTVNRAVCGLILHLLLHVSQYLIFVKDSLLSPSISLKLIITRSLTVTKTLYCIRLYVVKYVDLETTHTYMR